MCIICACVCVGGGGGRAGGGVVRERERMNRISNKGGEIELHPSSQSSLTAMLLGFKSR